MFMLRKTHQNIIDEKNIAGVKLAAKVNQLQRAIELHLITIDELNAEVEALKKPKPKRKPRLTK